jgi:Zn-dependent protease with chaperone function
MEAGDKDALDAHRRSDSCGFAQSVLRAGTVAWRRCGRAQLVALALVLCLRLVLRISAAHRFAAWAAGFAVVASLPFLPLLAHSGAAFAAAPLAVVEQGPWLELDSRWGFAIAALWLAASISRCRARFSFVASAQTVARRYSGRNGSPTCARCLPLHRRRPPSRIEICTTPDLDRPSVIGFLAPRILIPEWLFSRLTPGELEQVVLHEAEHLRRRDDWTNLLQKLFLVLFPLNPALAWMERRLCREREMACDEGVVQRTQAPRAYAACLACFWPSADCSGGVAAPRAGAFAGSVGAPARAGSSRS